MEEFFLIVFYGIVEGITEFLPISSTAHLILFEKFLGDHQTQCFNIFIQSGAVLAVVFIYWNKITNLFLTWKTHETQLYLLKLFSAFVVTVIGVKIMEAMGLELSDEIEPIAWALAIGAFAIFFSERYLKKQLPKDEITWAVVIIVGASQVIAAIFPGTSRSAATIIAAMFLGISRPMAIEFSFMLGIPTMFAAGIYKLWEEKEILLASEGSEIFNLLLGFFVSAVVAFVVVKWLIRYVQSHTFYAFAWYRLALGLILLSYLYFSP